uniref:recombinase family protein n=1 Tax=Shewanella sp. TaxID=50422 RepID=UPI0040483A9A
MRAYIYSRISSTKQKTGDGLDRQIELTHNYAKSLNLEIQQDSFQDIASGYHGKQMQGRLGVFLDAIKTGKVQTPCALVVESLDRLGREHTMDALPRLMDIINSGVVVHEVSTGVVYNREDTHKIHIAIAVMERAHNESKVKALRTKQAYKKAKQQAAETGKVITSLVPVWMEVKNNKIVLIPERAELVKRIFTMYLSGCGGSVISKQLRAEGIEYPVYNKKSFKTKVEWNEQRILKMIKSTATYGALTSIQPEHKDDVLYDYYPAVINIDTYNKAQQIMASRVVKKTKTHKLQNIFAGIMKCGACGASIQPSLSTTTKKGIKIPMWYLRCSDKAHGKSCKAKSINLPNAEYTILNFFRSLRFSKLQIDSTDEITTTKALVTKLDEQASNLLYLVSTGNQRAISMFEQIEQQLKEAKSKLVTLDLQNEKPQIERIETKDALDSSNIDLRRIVNMELQKVIDKIDVVVVKKEITFSVYFKNPKFGIKRIKQKELPEELPKGWHTEA